jgi:peptidyl-prolyl cis-trans isomerase SurA
MRFSVFAPLLMSLVLTAPAPARLAAAEPGAGTDNTVRDVDRIVAIVNNDVVTATELERRLAEVKRQLAAERRGALPADDVLRRQLLDRLIIERIQLQLAVQAGIRVTEADVDRAAARIAERGGLTVEALRERVTREGGDWAVFRASLRDQITIQQLQEREIGNRVVVTDNEVTEFIENEASRRGVNIEYHLAHILLALPEGASPEVIQETRGRAEALRQQLLAGTEFAQAAIGQSQGAEALQGGQLGWKKSGELPELFLAALKTMPVGAISEVLRSPSGFHLLKLIDKRGDVKADPIIQTHARHILLRPSEIQSPQEAQRKLAQMRERVLLGDDFATLARAHSEDPGSAINGGDLGWTSPGQMVPEFEKAMAELKPGEISQPVQSSFGWHLIQVLERRDRDVTQERVRAAARQQIHARKANERFEQWLRQLRDEAYVEYFLEDAG